MENYPLHTAGSSQMASIPSHHQKSGSGKIFNEIGNQVRNNATVINFNKVGLSKHKTEGVNGAGILSL